MIPRYLFIKQIHRHRKQTYGYQRGKVGGDINWKIGLDTHTLLYIKEINNKDILGLPWWSSG